MTTTKHRLPIQVKDLAATVVNDLVIAKQTKTYADVIIDLQAAGILYETFLAESQAKDRNTAGRIKMLKDAAKNVWDTHQSLASRDRDNAAFALTQHPIGALVPGMTKTELKDLEQSMKTQGYLSDYPVIVHQSQVLDGWHRYQVAEKLGIEPEFKDYRGDDPAGFVLATNLKRRHLSDDQRADVAASLSAYESADIDDMAAQANVKASKVKAAKWIRNRVPELADAVRSGDVPLTKAIGVRNRLDIVDKLKSGEFSIDQALAQVAADKEAKKSATVTIPVTGKDCWEYFDLVFDVNGVQIGEAYCKALPIPLEDIDTDPIIDAIRERTNSSTDKRTLRTDLKQNVDPHDLKALYQNFVGSYPDDDMRAVQIQTTVAEFMQEWFEGESQNIEDY